MILSGLVGIVMYAFYSTCDPIKFGLIMASDQVPSIIIHVSLVKHEFGVCSSATCLQLELVKNPGFMIQYIQVKRNQRNLVTSMILGAASDT